MVFALYIPFFFGALVYLYKHTPNHLVSASWISDFSKTNSKVYFNYLLFGFGGLSLFSGIAAILVLPPSIAANITVFFLYLSSISTITAAIFNYAKNLTIHIIAATVLFGSIAILAFSTTALVWLSSLPSGFMLLNLCVLVTLLALLPSWYFWYIRHPKKADTNIFIRYRGVFELATCVGAGLWNFWMAIYLFTRLV